MSLQLEYGGLHQVISGGQTGADQGGLLAAWRAGVLTGGTAPAGYKTQTGYNPLLETLGLVADGDYSSRTKKNIIDSDATVVIAHNPASPGTVLTLRIAKSLSKPVLLINVFEAVRILATLGADKTLTQIAEHGEELAAFVLDRQVRILNVAGNREIQGNGTVVTTVADWVMSYALAKLELANKLAFEKDFMLFKM